MLNRGPVGCREKHLHLPREIRSRGQRENSRMCVAGWLFAAEDWRCEATRHVHYQCEWCLGHMFGRNS